jgi:hypothetical protein
MWSLRLRSKRTTKIQVIFENVNIIWKIKVEHKCLTPVRIPTDALAIIITVEQQCSL